MTVQCVTIQVLISQNRYSLLACALSFWVVIHLPLLYSALLIVFVKFQLILFLPKSVSKASLLSFSLTQPSFLLEPLLKKDGQLHFHSTFSLLLNARCLYLCKVRQMHAASDPAPPLPPLLVVPPF